MKNINGIVALQISAEHVFSGSEEDKVLFYVNNGEICEFLKVTHESNLIDF